MTKTMFWASTEISVRAITDKNDPKLFTLKVNGKPPMTLDGLSFVELIHELRMIYVDSDITVNV
jgi:hypothetical protein